MINKAAALNLMTYYRELNLLNSLDGTAQKLRIGNYEYVFYADEVNYVGDGSEFIVASLTDDGWTNHGTQLQDNVLTLDGASWLSRGTLALGGRDFQISGTVFESATDMLARRKIFELYTSPELNISLYSSGAGKNLDLLVNCSGSFDNYTEPAILEQEYSFALKWLQDMGTLKLFIDGEEIYSLTVPGLATRQTFSQLLLGSSVLHTGANWLGRIGNFTVYDGYCEV